VSPGVTEASAAERIAQARTLRQAARYSEALSLLSGSHDWPAPHDEAGTLLRGHILSRIDPIAALAVLAQGQDLFRSDHGRFGYYVASMRAYIGTRNFDAAAGMGEMAELLVHSVPEAQRCLLWHLNAQLRICLERYDPADDDIVRLLESTDANGRFLGNVMRAYMYAGLAQFDKQADYLKAALAVATSHPGACDPGIIALQVHALLRIGLETGNTPATSAATDAYEWLPWSADLDDLKFLCVRALAWDAFLRGESAQAQWLLKDSKHLAGSAAWKVMAHLDRAYIARMNGNEHWAAEELVSARTIATVVEWGATNDEERQALVMLAIMLSPSDAAQAQHYVSLYLQLGRENVNPVLAVVNDQRAIAFEAYALGRVQQVLGNDPLAIRSFRKAYAIFDRAGYHFRAALAAIGLLETTGEPEWLDIARRHSDAFPHSSLRATLYRQTAAQENAGLRELTPMQRQIAFALCEGLDLAEMSQRFSRSAFTLERHVETIYDRLGVKTRTALRSTLEQWRVV
jgi:DNA-binding CsgD family transcriptional regulator